MSAIERSIIDIWVINLNPSGGSADGYLTLLSEPERAQVDRFQFEEMRHRYTIAHGRLREILSGYTNIPPNTLQIIVNRHGKPGLYASSDQGDFQFNLSHSSNLAILAITRDNLIGADIEWVKPLHRHMRIAEKYFSPEEITALKQMAPEDSNLAFIQLWSGKEAIIKARGLGLSVSLNSFNLAGLIHPENTQGKPIKCIVDKKTWSVYRLEIQPGYVGTVAVESGNHILRYFQG